MIDKEISLLTLELKSYIDHINSVMEKLHNKNCEVRIQYKDGGSGASKHPTLELWRLIEHNDYLKSSGTTDSPKDFIKELSKF